MDMSASDGSAAALPSGPESGTTPARIRNSKATDWPEEHTEAFRRMIEIDGLSAGEAADALNARFGTSYTRNACCGRRHRLFLKGPGRPKASIQEIRAKRAERRARRRAASLDQPRRPLPYLVRCVAVEPLGITFDMMASDPNACKWPGEEYPYTYCGHPREDGRPYCPAHCTIGTTDNPKQRKERPGQVYAPRRHMAASSILQSSLMDDPDNA